MAGRSGGFSPSAMNRPSGPRARSPDGWLADGPASGREGVVGLPESGGASRVSISSKARAMSSCRESTGASDSGVSRFSSAMLHPFSPCQWIDVYRADKNVPHETVLQSHLSMPKFKVDPVYLSPEH